MRARTILVVDDDPHIRDVICFALEKASYLYEVAADGEAAVRKAAECDPALIVLDIGLPEMDGLEVCRNIRKSSEVPILFLSARDEEVDRIVGLEIGADDYVTKPFSPRELIARIGAILKRYNNGGGTPVPDVLSRGRLEMEREQHRAVFAGAQVNLTAIEFNILAMLLARPQLVFTREQILQGAYKDNIHVSDRTIDSHIRNIRGKMSAAGCDDAIETVHGVGFRLGACV
ncbi:response regulator transcription factor [Roseibium sp.]|uniref:response regulator transcription factor n=1 Tax=Roseibium sp. TaxID=1936156 RepID=UPI003A96D28E